MWEIMNRGKRCIGIDVSTDEGRDLLLDLVARADVFITNLLPGAPPPLPRSTPTTSSRSTRASSTARASAVTATEGPSASPAASTTPTSGPAPASATPRAWWPTSSCPQAGPAIGDLASAAFLAGGDRRRAAPARAHRPGRGRRRVAAVVGHVGGCRPASWPASSTASTPSRATATPTCRTRSSPPTPPATAGTIYLSGIQTEGHFENFCDVIDRKDLLDDPRFATGAGPAGDTGASASRSSTRSSPTVTWPSGCAILRQPVDAVDRRAVGGGGRGRPAGHRQRLRHRGRGRDRAASRWSRARPSSTAVPTALTPRPGPRRAHRGDPARARAATGTRSCASRRQGAVL